MATHRKLAGILFPQERLIVMLRYVDRLTLREIARVLEIHPACMVGLRLLSLRRNLRRTTFWRDPPAKSTQAAQAEPGSPSVPATRDFLTGSH
jgi:hypothetical protein